MTGAISLRLYDFSDSTTTVGCYFTHACIVTSLRLYDSPIFPGVRFFRFMSYRARNNACNMRRKTKLENRNNRRIGNWIMDHNSYYSILRFSSLSHPSVITSVVSTYRLKSVLDILY